ARKRVRRVEADRREHRQELAEEKLADPLALRRVPLLAPRENDAFAGERRQHDVVEQPVLGGDERVRLAAHRLEHLRGGARVRTRLGKPELDAFLQPGDADLEELVEVGGDDGDETQPLEQRHRVVGRHRQHAAVERENAELAVEKLRRKRCSAVHGEASILPVPCYRIRAMARHDTLAAVDLGSNSFHLQIGRVVDGQIYPLDALREVLRLGAGLTAEKRIDRGTQAHALEPVARFAERRRGFPRQAVGAVGSSGTARSMQTSLRENGFADEGLTREGLERLRALLIKHEKADPERIAGLRPNRAPVLPGGLAIMSAALDELGIEAMKVSEGALRHGVLYDLLGRVQHRDMREATVTQFVRRYHIDAAQAERVRSLSLKIYDGLAPG